MILRHILSILALPTMVTVVIPYLIVSGGQQRGSMMGITSILGFPAILAGLFLVVVTVRHFAISGKGTLAPWDPTRRLVMAGVYRHVRNPMISGVTLILLGEALVLRSTGVLIWCLVFFAINAVYIPLVEEPGLLRRFGQDYAEYRRTVPRWIPLLRHRE
jgi:protein-S-isoprenylcysteine O-methyltransferase Ste14